MSYLTVKLKVKKELELPVPAKNTEIQYSTHEKGDPPYEMNTEMLFQLPRKRGPLGTIKINNVEFNISHPHIT